MLINTNLVLLTFHQEILFAAEFQVGRRTLVTNCTQYNCSPVVASEEFKTVKIDARLGRLLKGIRTGDRGCLAEGITLVETEHAGRRLLAKALLETILQENCEHGEPESLRIGVDKIFIKKKLSLKVTDLYYCYPF